VVRMNAIKIYPKWKMQLLILSLIYILGVSTFVFFTHYMATTGNVRGFYMWLVGTIIVIVGLPIYGIYYWKITRPYVITDKWIEFPKAYLPEGGDEIIRFEEIIDIGYFDDKKYGRIFGIKTDKGNYIIRENLKKEILGVLENKYLW